MTFSVIIPTRDRCLDLAVTCSKLLTLTPPPDEVLICADACRDDTLTLLRGRFPTIRLLQNSVVKGSVLSRDRLLRAARGDIVLSLDDDSHPVQHDFFLKLGAVFENHPEAVVVSFPELRPDGRFASFNKTNTSPGHYVSAYANCAAAMRRTFYMEQPGFPHFFGHMYEEPDYALQCYAAGAGVWFEPSLVIEHRQSIVNRGELVRHHLNARNELWSVWLRCPWPAAPFVSAWRVTRQFLYAASQGFTWALCEPLWWCAAFRGLVHCRQNHLAVPWPVYLRWMTLPRKPIHSPEQLRRQFPRTRLLTTDAHR